MPVATPRYGYLHSIKKLTRMAMCSFALATVYFCRGDGFPDGLVDINSNGSASAVDINKSTPAFTGYARYYVYFSNASASWLSQVKVTIDDYSGSPYTGTYLGSSLSTSRSLCTSYRISGSARNVRLYVYGSCVSANTTGTTRSVKCYIVEEDVKSGASSAYHTATYEFLIQQRAESTIENDSFSSPIIISDASGSRAGSNAGATLETSETKPSAQSSSTGSVWYKWTAPSSGTVTFDTVGSGFDTVLGVYTGSSVSSLTEIDSNDDIESGNTKSRVTFTANSGTTYRIAVYGYNGANGSFTLNWSLTSGGGGSGGNMKYALCVGINNYSLAGCTPLNGCVNDAAYFRDNLVNRGGWTGANMTMLTNNVATKSAIRNAIASYAARAVQGDTFIYQHSSHGGSAKDSSGDYTKDVCLCTYNANYWDYELAADLALFASGVKVVVIADTCHSGGLFKSVGKQADKGFSFDIASRVSALIDNQREAEAKVGTKTVTKGISSSEIGWATAAEYNKTSADGACYDSTSWMQNFDAYNYDSPHGGFRCGGAFMAALTWGWWTGQADSTSTSVGNGTGSMDAYEGFSYAKSILNDIGLNPPVCLNTGVLRNVTLGANGGLPTSPRLTVRDWTSSGSTSVIELEWSGVNNATSYRVYRSTSPFSRPASACIATEVTSTSYTDSSSALSSGTRYYYWVEAVNTSGTAFSGADYGYVGNSVVPLSTGLDNTSLSFSSSSGNPWWGIAGGTSHDGVDAAHSGKIGDNQDSWMTVTFFGAGTLSFWWKSSCELPWRDGSGVLHPADYLEVLVDGTQKQLIYGETDWTKVTLEITGSGEHTIKWNFHKDYSALNGSDCGWVDQVTWTPSAPATQSVTFNANGGSCSVSEATYTIGGTYASPSLPTASRTGYSFAGWWTSSSGGTQITASSTVSSSTIRTLYAHWTPITYNINYSLGDGGTHGATHPSSKSYDEVFYVSAPTKSGYTFTGWTVTSGLNTSTAKYGTTSSSQTTSITSSSQKCLNGATGDVWFKNLRSTSGSVTLTANWTATDLPNLTPITFQGWSGPLVVSASASNSTNCTATTFAAADNLYVSWAANCSGASINDLFYSDLYVDDVRVTRWHTDEVVVRHSFYIMGYSLGNLSVGTHTIRIVYDSTALVSESDESDNSVTKTITIVDAKPDLCFMQASGHPAAVYLAKPETPLVPNTTFVQGDGIYLYNRFGNGGEAVISGNYKIVHQVRNQSGTVIGEAIYNCTNDFYKLDVGGYLVWDGPRGIIPQNLGIGTYTYTCTLDTENTISESDETNNAVSIPFEIVAESVLTTYTITFNSNRGTGTMAAQTFTNGVAQALRANAFTRTGYMFAGWATNTTGAVVYTNGASIAPNADMTLYAKWTGNTYAVTLNQQGGSGGTASVTATYGNSMPSIAKPTRSGYMFGGYYTATSGNGTQYYTAAGDSARTWNIASATTLYANWIPTVSLTTALDNTSMMFTTGGSENWVGVTNVAYFGGSSARSGAITHSQTTWMQTEVSGEGTLSFWYKVSSESNCDKLIFYIDGVQKATASGTGSDWRQFECVVSNSTQHVFKWMYSKDGSVSTGSDCCWVDKVEWTPANIVIDIGDGKSVTVPSEWLVNITEQIQAAGGDVSVALRATAANGRLSNVECYILGLDPGKVEDDFKIVSFPMKADGTPDIGNIVFDPPQTRWNVPATYKVKGAPSLTGPWDDVPSGGNPAYRFFKVSVEMP